MGSLVTVIIPFYNPGPYLTEAINSVFVQTYKNWRMILIDDSSTDNSVSTIQPLLKDKRIKLIRNKKNLGQSKSLNIGLLEVTTPYVVQLDADDWFEKYTLETLVKEAKKLPKDVGVLSGNFHVVFVNSRGKQRKKVLRKGKNFRNCYDFLLENSTIMPRFYLTSALRQIGGWPTDDPYEGRYMEDLRVLYRLIENYHLHWIDKPLYNYRVHDKNQTNNVSIYANMTEWTVRDALKRWGDQYEPMFIFRKDGWKLLERLISKNKSCSEYLKFQGNIKINIKSIFAGIKNSFTYEFWVKPETFQQHGSETNKGKLKKKRNKFVISPGNRNNINGASIGISVGENGISLYELTKNHSPHVLVYKTQVKEWTHIAIVYKNKTPFLYLNGKFVKKGEKSIHSHVFASGVFGGYHGNCFQGYIDEIRIWDHARTEKQIMNYYGTDLTENEAGLFGYWTFKGRFGKFVKDNTINSNHGVINKFPNKPI